MRVGIPVDILHQQHERTGIGRYTLSLLKYISSIEDLDIVPISADGKLKGDYPWKSTMVVLNKVGNHKLIHKLVRYTSELRRLKLDVIHCPGDFPPRYFAIARGRKVVTVHGIASLIFADDMNPRVAFAKRLAVKFLHGRVDHFITDAHSTKEGLAQHFAVPREKIEVIELGVDHDRFQPPGAEQVTAVKRHYNLQSPYVLHVSNYHPRKNLFNIVEAFAIVRQQGFREVQLVIAGGGGWRYEEFLRYIEPQRSRGEILLLGQIEENWLPSLYAGAEVFVFPSLYEGFGLPVLEAMACGTPVVTSNVFSLPEVAGDAAIRVNPESVEAISDAMITVLNDKRLREALREKGIERAKQFTWQACAKKHLKLYQNLCAGR
jgi:glycosyltransferase involved in cell wall biosynthesis